MTSTRLILENANVVDVEDGSSRAASIVVEGDKIQAIGRAEDIAGAPRDDAEVIDLSGKTVVPGFIDSHVHLTETGFSLLDINVRQAGSVRDILDMVAERAAGQPPNTLIRGWSMQEHTLREGRFPTRQELDAVAPGHYVHIFREDGHASVVNSKALEYSGLTLRTSGVDAEGGEPTGALRAEAQSVACGKLAELETPQMRRDALRAAAREALRVGLTTVQALEGSNMRPHEEFVETLDVMSQLPIHTVAWYQTTKFERFEGLDLGRIGGCILVDGAPGSYTGALFEPYSDRPDTRGVLYFADDALDAFVLAAHERGWQIALHATCQRAVEQALRAYEKALDACPRTDHRMRIEHCYGLPTKDQFIRMAERGIIWSTQPAFLHYRMEMYYRRFADRWTGVHPHRMGLEAGVTIAGGSDSYVTPLYPLLGIHCAVNHPVEAQRVEVAEALRWFTCNAARAAFEDNEKGTVAPGKLADLTVLGRDILTEDAATIKDIPVEMTIVAGRISSAPEAWGRKSR